MAKPDIERWLQTVERKWLGCFLVYHGLSSVSGLSPLILICFLHCKATLEAGQKSALTCQKKFEGGWLQNVLLAWCYLHEHVLGSLWYLRLWLKCLPWWFCRSPCQLFQGVAGRMFTCLLNLLNVLASSTWHITCIACAYGLSKIFPLFSPLGPGKLNPRQSGSNRQKRSCRQC